MSKVEVRHEFPGILASDCYKACLSVVEPAGYKLFKKRDIANLVICSGTVQGHRADLTLMVPFGNPTSIVVSLTSEETDQAFLTAEAERIIGLISKSL